MVKRISFIWLVCTGLLLFFFASCDVKNPLPTANDNTNGGTQTENPTSVLSSSDEMETIKSTSQLYEVLEKETPSSSSLLGSLFSSRAATTSFAASDMAFQESASGSIAPTAANKVGVSEEASSYSGTNVQVETIDEADFVKTDGEYIYSLQNGILTIAKAYPPEKAEIVSETEFTSYPNKMYVKDDLLYIFTQEYAMSYVLNTYNFLPSPSYKQVTAVLVYDISDKEKPTLQNNYSLDGYYFESRMSGDYIYLITQDYLQFDYLSMPSVKEGSRTLQSADISYFTSAGVSDALHNVLVLDAKSGDIENFKSFMLGYSSTLYMSEDALYIAYQKSTDYDTILDSNKEFFETTVISLLPTNVQKEITETLSDSSLKEGEKWDTISRLFEQAYNALSEPEKETLIQNIQEAYEEYEATIEEERSRTVIHKISIDGAELTYEERAEVKGTLLNQFSLDENNGFLRVATTINNWRSDEKSSNNVYVLDPEMKQVGSIEKIAPGERIYSTRFMGDKLYMVTFKQVDPLFVIDLSNPEEPKILGALKIPGFSDYLQAYDENLLIGIGKETYETSYGAVRTKGVKVSLFDVSDFSNPREVDSVVIGDEGSQSIASYEHKAVLLSKEKGILVLPVYETKGSYNEDERGYYKEDAFNGAYVFSISSDGLEERGTISHEDTSTTEWSWYPSSAILRSLYMDDILYTVSQSKIQLNDLESLEKLNELKLKERKEEVYYPEYIDVELPVKSIQIDSIDGLE
ncbi:beta-propeller domain-containing protein [Candidatus Woesearchaeota archaeon]|nr:beta-propeller domain-containing protein [Candidatus Woesearchaeota archaeon]USN43758.1 MAG: beta-propeller domain-containing protein [Candidatus Woesearchaeota archaeon]